MKIITIVGARPQFVKAAVVSRVLRKFYKEIIIHTGQHYDDNMSDIFFQQLDIPCPDYNLEIGSASHGKQTAKMMQALEVILDDERPDYILVYGDTNSTLAAALVASKLNIKIIHVEAGLRSFDMSMPEEINRVVTDRLSSILFAPTKIAKDNLKKEGITKGVYVVGDVMCDAVLRNIASAGTAETSLQGLNKLTLHKKKIFLTLHRQALIPMNASHNFAEQIFEVLGKCEEDVIFPVHPRTKKFLKEKGLLDKIKKYKNITIIDPVGYVDCLWLIKNARIVITDSGGIQKEAYILGTPCITVREQTEWVETVESGWNFLTGFNKDKLESAINNFCPTGKRPKHYGNGKTGERIVEKIKSFH